MNKPKFYTLEIEEALNEIRNLNKVNMFLAGSFLQKEFFITEKEADQCILYWINHHCNEGTYSG